jgi:hypothetical protein
MVNKNKKKKYYKLHCSQGNTEISGIEEGQIGMWVAKFGGNDAEMEKLLLEKKVEIAKQTLTLTLEGIK